MEMRPSRVLQKLRAGEVVSCFKLNLSCARVAELAGVAGYDCIWVDMEHTASDWGVVEKQIWAAKTRDTDVMVRVTRGSYSDYTRPLELDAAGILVPHIMSLEDARHVVRMTRFHPIGRRPVDGGNADGIYCNIEFKDYLRQANENRFLSVQIEDPEPVADLEAIAKLEGIDMLFFGPADFSHGLGAPGDFTNPKLLETRRRVAEVCREHGIFAGTVASLDNLEELVEMGYRFLSVGADVLGLNSYTQGLIQGFRERTSQAVLSKLLV